MHANTHQHTAQGRKGSSAEGYCDVFHWKLDGGFPLPQTEIIGGWVAPWRSIRCSGLYDNWWSHHCTVLMVEERDILCRPALHIHFPWVTTSGSTPTIALHQGESHVSIGVLGAWWLYQAGTTSTTHTTIEHQRVEFVAQPWRSLVAPGCT